MVHLEFGQGRLTQPHALKRCDQRCFRPAFNDLLGFVGSDLQNHSFLPHELAW